MPKQKLIAVAAVVGIVVVAAAIWLQQRAEHDTCGVCRRSIHAQARAVIETNGKQEGVCCVRCALTLARQRGTPVRLLQVTDYVSSRSMRPDDAFYVEGSRIILCERHEPLLDSSKHSYERVFDRCEPSLYAFARRADAEKFAEDYGGEVLRLPQLLREVEARP